MLITQFKVQEQQQHRYVRNLKFTKYFQYKRLHMTLFDLHFNCSKLTEGMIWEISTFRKSTISISIGQGGVGWGGREGSEDLVISPAWVGRHEKSDGSSGVGGGL